MLRLDRYRPGEVWNGIRGDGVQRARGLYSFSGRFRSGKLGPFRAWVNDYRNCVIIETLSETLVVSPGDPERFAEEVRNRFWSGS